MKNQKKIIQIDSDEPLMPEEFCNLGFPGRGVYLESDPRDVEMSKSWLDAKVIFHRPTKSFDLTKATIKQFTDCISGEMRWGGYHKDRAFEEIKEKHLGFASNALLPLVFEEWGEDYQSEFGYIPDFWHKNSSVKLPFLGTIYEVKRRWRFDEAEPSEDRFCLGLYSRVHGPSNSCPSYLNFCVRWHPTIYRLSHIGEWTCRAIVATIQ